MMWVRGIGGVALLLLGAIWILQGVNVLHGSGMSGHVQFAVLGLIVILFAAWLLNGLRRAGARAGDR